MTDKELIEAFKAYNPDCISSKAPLRHEFIAAELEDRGFEIQERMVYSFWKNGKVVEGYEADGKAVVY